MKKFILVHEVARNKGKQIIIPVKGIRRVREKIITVNNTEEKTENSIERELIRGSLIYLLSKYRDDAYDYRPIEVFESPEEIYNLIYPKEDNDIC